ncbi:unnamed protein product, partial [Oppiella nova]
MWPSNGGHEESQGWTREQHQWSSQQSSYCLSVPHESVDWAQLAKQWIQMQGQSPHTPPPPPPHHRMPQPMVSMASQMPPIVSQQLHPRPPPLPPHFAPLAPGVGPHRPLVIPEDMSRPVYQTPIEANNWNRSRPPVTIIHHSLPPMAPMPPIPQPLLPTPPPPMRAMRPPMGLNYQPPYDWRAPGGPPPMHSPNSGPSDGGKPAMDQMMESMAALDAAKKKNLPIWLREGLEKMERERNRQKEREKEEHERMERARAVRHKEEELRREIEWEQKLANRYASDDDDDRDSNEGSVGGHRSGGDESAPVDEEQMMLRVRKVLTQLLLEVTDSEIESIATDAYNKALDRVPAVRLSIESTSFKKPTASGGLTGLSGYGSESDDSADQMDDRSDEKRSETDQNTNNGHKSDSNREKDCNKSKDKSVERN